MMQVKLQILKKNVPQHKQDHSAILALVQIQISFRA